MQGSNIATNATWETPRRIAIRSGKVWNQHARRTSVTSITVHSVYERLVDLASTSQIALLCYERDHDQCHRSCILETALTDHPRISILRL